MEVEWLSAGFMQKGDKNMLIDVRNLVKIYSSGIIRQKQVIAVDNISFNISKGELVSLLGESGSGKTTVARIILRLTAPTSGQILFKGIDIFSLRGKELKKYRASVQAIFQDPYSAFNPFYKIDRALKVTAKKFLPDADPDEVAIKALQAVRLNPDEVLGRYPHQLSGGQLQRVLIAKALIPKPELLIADEPISMVDMSLRIDIVNLLRELVDNYNMSVLMITHEANIAFYASDRVLVMYKGKIVEMGSADELLRNPLHPYTNVLIEAVPRASRDIERKLLKKSIELELSSRVEEFVETRGCKFYPRCPFAMDICKKQEPQLIQVKPGHFVSCWLYK